MSGYKLNYTDNGIEISMSFPSDLDIYEMQENLTRFLLACSWQLDTINSLFGESIHE